MQHAERIEHLRRRHYDALRAGARGLSDEAWKEKVEEAAHIVSEKHREMTSFDAMPPSPTFKRRTRIITDDQIPLYAEDLLAVEALLADALTQVAVLRADNHALREKFVAGYQASIAIDEQYLWDLEQMGHRTAGRDGEALVAVIAEVRGYRKAATL